MISRESLNKFAKFASERSEVIAAAMIFLVVIMMIVPLNAVFLDICIAVNISVASLLVVIAVFLPSPLAFSSFPAVLLISTLFRLAITVSTTRLILLDGYSGHIVETFGEFVVGGNVSVGVIVFLIIAVVNFIVVTKGSERVAEVAARFSLDGMPGKQMSIDSDLRANLIDQNQAKIKRSNLEKETQLFGAMDGAIKFVKGDAIAGLIIVIINMVGGLFIGVLQKGMSFSDAAARYSLLSVGDGLVALIPSLLVSIAAGMIVTRVSQDEDSKSSVGSDIANEVIRNPKALLVTCFFIACIGAIPGMPSTVFIGMAIGFGTLWFFRKNTLQQIQFPTHSQASVAPSNFDLPVENKQELRSISLLSITFSTAINSTLQNRIENAAKITRNNIIDQYGVVLPIIEFRKSHADENSSFTINIQEIPIYSGTFEQNLVAAQASTNTLESNSISFKKEKDSITGITRNLVDLKNVNLLENLKIPYKKCEEIFSETFEALVLKEIKSFFTLSEFSKFLAKFESIIPDAVKEMQRSLQNSKIQDVFIRLLSEGVSINNLELIASVLSEWASKERDLVIICEHVRISLKNQLSHQYAYKGQIYAYVVGSDIEDMVRSALRQTATGSFLALDDDTKKQISEHIEKSIVYPTDTPYRPVLICSPDCRRYVRRLIDENLFWLSVLSFPEISKHVSLNMLGEISLEEDGF
ncbi:MAG: type III secretion system export apparatus subunit SctV [Burkholderiaceae bacterium]|jgi:type III secretion protein V